jgi:anti-sigma factor RsiW
MKDSTHVTTEELAAYEAGQMEGTEAERVRGHLAGCPDCAARAGSLQQFVQDLDKTWNQDRLRAMGAVHPSTAELEALWLNEPSAFDLPAVRRHTEECASCRTHLERLEQGFAALEEVDPLGQSAWSETVRKRFAVGIEMFVEAAQGAYTSAAGMMRDVMTPQARVKLAPAPALAMGGHAQKTDSVAWNDATFLTDEASGEITGSTDPNTGRGIITVMIDKTGAYVASPPIVDIVNEKGKAVATQFALDMGDRYSAHFADLDQGRYLIGIREPGD